MGGGRSSPRSAGEVMRDTVNDSSFLACPGAAFGKAVARLGLASHGETEITPDDVLFALERGVGFLDWAKLAGGSRPGPCRKAANRFVRSP